MPPEAALDPQNRALYGDILRPPPGYGFDCAVATTYTLDFETALVIPATLAFHAAESRQETLDSPLALLEGLERLAGRIAIYCEAGRIQGAPDEGHRRRPAGWRPPASRAAPARRPVGIACYTTCDTVCHIRAEKLGGLEGSAEPLYSLMIFETWLAKGFSIEPSLRRKPSKLDIARSGTAVDRRASRRT